MLMSDDRQPPLRFGEAQKRLNLSRYLTRRAIDLGLLDVQFRVGRTEMISVKKRPQQSRCGRKGYYMSGVSVGGWRAAAHSKGYHHERARIM